MSVGVAGSLSRWLAVSVARSQAEPAVGPFDSPTEGIPQPAPSHGLALSFFEVLPGSFDFGYTGFVVTFLSTRDELHGQGLPAGPSAAPAGENIFTPVMVTAPARLADEIEYPAGLSCAWFGKAG